MKHAGETALNRIDPMLAELRQFEGFRERKRGLFYRGSQAFLHFHEDPAGIFADVRSEDAWLRLPVNTTSERRNLVRVVREILSKNG
jgi:hypothetical protein